MILNLEDLKNYLYQWKKDDIRVTDVIAIKKLRNNLVGSGITIEDLVDILNTYFKDDLPTKATPKFIDQLLDLANVPRW